ncbi:MAG: exonuclease SbcCD subunit D [Proteocatella sp.]
MKIFHLSDLHLGKIVNNFSMIEDQAYVLEQLYVHIENEKPDVVLLAGDLYDRSIPPVQAVELLNQMFFKIVKTLNTPIIAISGNHDSSERIDFGSSLFYQTSLYINGVLKPNIDKITLQDNLGPVNFYPIPFSDPAVIRNLFEDENVKSFDDSMKKIVSNMDIDTAQRNIAIAHGFITCINNNGEDEISLETSESEKMLSIGGTDHINASLFEHFDYTALGHLHGPQKVSSDKIRYSGSLIKYSFSEANQKKGITVVELFEKGNLKIDFIPFELKRNFRILEDSLENILKNATSDQNKEDYIKAIITDKGELLDPMAKLRAVYPNAMELVRKERYIASQNTERSISNIKNISKLSLFENFYEEITGEKCADYELDIIKEIISAVEGSEF